MLKASNNLIKDLKKQKRDNCSLLFLDNVKIINDAISQGISPKLILVSNEEKYIWNENIPHYLVEHKTIEQLSDSKTPQGVVCIVDYTQNIDFNIQGNVLILDNLQDPGNVGTLIRSATASGFNNVFLIDSVKINNSKLIRSSAGTIFKNNIYSMNKNDFLKISNKLNVKFIKADMYGENIFTKNFNEAVGLILGNEGNGVSKELGNLCSESISIPMQNDVESLNVAISGSIIMYEINKNIF